MAQNQNLVDKISCCFQSAYVTNCRRRCPLLRVQITTETIMLRAAAWSGDPAPKSVLVLPLIRASNSSARLAQIFDAHESLRQMSTHDGFATTPCRYQGARYRVCISRDNLPNDSENGLGPGKKAGAEIVAV